MHNGRAKGNSSFALKSTGKSSLSSAAGSIQKWIYITLCIPASCWCKWVELHCTSEGLPLVCTDLFLNVANNKIIFICFNCRFGNHKCYEVAKDDKSTKFYCICEVNFSSSPSFFSSCFSSLHTPPLVCLSFCPHYLLLSHILRLNLKSIEVKCKTSLNATEF